jgi:serine/threonine-protein kinase RsbW
MTSTAMEKATLRIGNTIAEMSKVAQFVEAFAQTHGLARNVVNDMSLCLDELLNNTISHGYPDDGRRFISISLSISPQIEGRALVAELQDDATRFDPRRTRARRRSSDLGRRRAGGLGLRFVNALMDQVDYARTGEYNQVTLKKTLQPTDAEARRQGKK